MLELVIIDSTVLSNTKGSDISSLEKLCAKFRARGIKIAVVSTNNIGMKKYSQSSIRIPVDYTLSGQDIYHTLKNSFKGGPDRIEKICDYFGISAYKTLYIGDDKWDYASAINSGAFFILAKWVVNEIDNTMHPMRAKTPEAIWIFATHFLMHPPRWTFSIDNDTKKFQFRSLLSANTKGNAARYSGNSPYDKFDLIQLLKDQIEINVGGLRASSVLFWHTIASARLEGLIPPYSYTTLYPSSTPNNLNAVLSDLGISSSRFFGGYYREDIIERTHKVEKSRNMKLKGADSFLLQSNSVILNKDRIDSIKGKTVTIIDDFHTTGKSLDWARNLMIAAGASNVVLITPGKFGGQNKPHEIYTPTSDIITPFRQKIYNDSDFSMEEEIPHRSNDSTQIIQASFDKLKAGLPYYED